MDMDVCEPSSSGTDVAEVKAPISITSDRLLVQPSDSVSSQLNSVITVHRRAPTDLVELAQEVNQANRFVRATAHSKLQQIADQIRFLQEQAKQVLEAAVHDGELHNAKCNFKKRPGTVYHLYRKAPGSTFVSMLSPEEWSSCPHEFLGSYKLEFDMSWTPIEQMEQRAKDMALIDRLLSEKTNLPALASN